VTGSSFPGAENLVLMVDEHNGKHSTLKDKRKKSLDHQKAPNEGMSFLEQFLRLFLILFSYNSSAWLQSTITFLEML